MKGRKGGKEGEKWGEGERMPKVQYPMTNIIP